MRKMIAVLLLCLLLCGCTEGPAEETTLPPQTQPTEAVEPTGTYEPDSELERATDGAVRSYALNPVDVYHMGIMGDVPVVFSGSETTTLTALAGENLYVQGTLALAFRLEGIPSTQITEKGLSYVDVNTRELVFLDTFLKEAKRVTLPEELVGDPIVSADRQTVYYFTADSVRALDLETGIKRLVKQISYPVQTMKNLLLGDSIIRCTITDESGKQEDLFLSAQTGETMERSGRDLEIASTDAFWYAGLEEGAVTAMVFGTDEAQSQLWPRDILADCCYQPRHHTAVMIRQGEPVELDRYDLSTGARTASVSLRDVSELRFVLSGENEQYIWFLCQNTAQESPRLCRWDTSMSPVEDANRYTEQRYTQKNPNTSALDQCRARAQEIGAHFGVEIRIGTDAVAVQPENYTLTMECAAPVIDLYLDKLETMLSVYPGEFLPLAAETTDSGKIRICLVRSLQGTPVAGDLGPADGTQFWEDQEAYVVVALGGDFEGSFFHEMCHALETRVYAHSDLYDDWDKLNPDGFAYDFDYLANAARDGSAYLEGESRAFIDTYSMSYPKEDRATIMEYAMIAGNEAYFQSEFMQKKLYNLCKGIRQAFDLTKSEEVFLWEQYLETPLAYQPKK